MSIKRRCCYHLPKSVKSVNSILESALYAFSFAFCIFFFQNIQLIFKKMAATLDSSKGGENNRSEDAEEDEFGPQKLSKLEVSCYQ